MPDALTRGLSTSNWLWIGAAAVALVALLIAIARFAAQWLDRRGEREEFDTEGGRHDWRGRRRKRR